MSKLDEEGRRKLMARFRPKDTKPEILVRKALHGAGRRFRLHASALPGKPDIVMRRDRTVVMVHGCFWHAHEGCRGARIPASRPDFWKAKFEANRLRDVRNIGALEGLGWRVLVIWECEAKNPTLLAQKLRPLCGCPGGDHHHRHENGASLEEGDHRPEGPLLQNTPPGTLTPDAKWAPAP